MLSTCVTPPPPSLIRSTLSSPSCCARMCRGAGSCSYMGPSYACVRVLASCSYVGPSYACVPALAHTPTWGRPGAVLPPAAPGRRAQVRGKDAARHHKLYRTPEHRGQERQHGKPSDRLEHGPQGKGAGGLRTSCSSKRCFFSID